MRFPARPAVPEPEEQDCLDGFRALSEELRRAILAIAANDSIAFEASVGRQAAGAAELRAALMRLERTRSERGQATSKPVKARMFRSAKELAALNEEYAALTMHSSESLRLLALLHNRTQPDRAGNSWQA